MPRFDATQLSELERDAIEKHFVVAGAADVDEPYRRVGLVVNRYRSLGFPADEIRCEIVGCVADWGELAMEGPEIRSRMVRIIRSMTIQALEQSSCRHGAP